MKQVVTFQSGNPVAHDGYAEYFLAVFCDRCYAEFEDEDKERKKEWFDLNSANISCQFDVCSKCIEEMKENSNGCINL